MKYLYLLVSLFFTLATMGQSSPTSLQVFISGASSDTGSIRILVFSKPAGFPDQVKQAVRSISLTPPSFEKAAFVLGKTAVSLEISLR